MERQSLNNNESYVHQILADCKGKRKRKRKKVLAQRIVSKKAKLSVTNKWKEFFRRVLRNKIFISIFSALLVGTITQGVAFSYEIIKENRAERREEARKREQKREEEIKKAEQKRKEERRNKEKINSDIFDAFSEVNSIVYWRKRLCSDEKDKVVLTHKLKEAQMNLREKIKEVIKVAKSLKEAFGEKIHNDALELTLFIQDLEPDFQTCIPNDEFAGKIKERKIALRDNINAIIEKQYGEEEEK